MLPERADPTKSCLPTFRQYPWAPRQRANQKPGLGQLAPESNTDWLHGLHHWLLGRDRPLQPYKAVAQICEISLDPGLQRGGSPLFLLLKSRLYTPAALWTPHFYGCNRVGS